VRGAATKALAAVLGVVGVSLVGGEPAPDFVTDWAQVERDIQAAWPGVVLDLRYEPAEDFVTVLVVDGTDQATAESLSCETIVPVMHDAGSRALFAIYAESGDIVSSWNRCPLTPPPSPPSGG
jgi:hypothetical protein